ncbi:hypothetical protein SDC9_132617 [bioreactor metagenome]|uniref:Copper amine oxidase-like N-terminal domain-containing protein n=1 Tax=bioreactor metagenome TaxID=1076179 RepID=A0A645D835_9ZZZZ
MLVLALLVSSAAAAEDVYFLSLNDTLSPLTADLIPIRINNLIYVPSGMFDRVQTGVNLGVYFGQDKATSTATLYSREKTLIFDINGGYAYDSTRSVYYAYRAVIRNGRTYMPAFSICQFFGLEYSALSTDYGPLIRIKSGQVWLTDAVFVSSAATLMRDRLNEYLQSQASPGASSTPVPSASPTPSSSPSGGDKSDVTVYLAMTVDGEAGLEQVLDLLDAQWAPVLFFFRPDQLAEHDDLVRRILGSGHLIGLWPQGETLEELEGEINQGNRLLERIARQRTYTVLVRGSDSLRGQLSADGYACWLENVDGRINGRSGAALYSAVMGEISAKKALAKVLLDDSISPTTLSRLLRQLSADRYELAPAVETTC